MIPPHLFYQIYLSFLEQNDCTPPKCGELSEYTDSAHTQVEDLPSHLNKMRRKERNVIFNDALNTFLFTVIWHGPYCKGPFRQ